MLISLVKHCLLSLVTRLNRGIKGYEETDSLVTFYKSFHVKHDFKKVTILQISSVKHSLLPQVDKVKRVIEGYEVIGFPITFYNPI